MKQIIADNEINAEGFLSIEGKSFHHLKNVLRVSCGDMIFVRFKNGTLQPMTVCKVDGQAKKIILQITGDFSNDGDDQLKKHTQITLFQFITKPAKMDLIIRQATECGVENIFPVEGAFCQKGNVVSARKKSCENSRWFKIVMEAREQSGSPVETRVFAPIVFSKIFEIWENEKATQNSSLAIILYERNTGAKTIYDALENADSYSSKFDSKKDFSKIALVVGTEGGISSNEMKLLQKNGFIPVHFKTNVLRCETATLYGIAALQTILNQDWYV